MRADQKCPHVHAYHAMVNVLPGNAGTPERAQAGHDVCSLSRRGGMPSMPLSTSNSRAAAFASLRRGAA